MRPEPFPERSARRSTWWGDTIRKSGDWRRREHEGVDRAIEIRLASSAVFATCATTIPNCRSAEAPS